MHAFTRYGKRCVVYGNVLFSSFFSAMIRDDVCTNECGIFSTWCARAFHHNMSEISCVICVSIHSSVCFAKVRKYVYLHFLLTHSSDILALCWIFSYYIVERNFPAKRRKSQMCLAASFSLFRPSDKFLYWT